MTQHLGVCQWFHYEDFAQVDRAARLLRDLGAKHLRTGISWADFHRPRGPQWYDRQIEALREFDLLVSIWHTPPSIAETGRCNSPPARLADYADFIDGLIDRYGDRISHIELWNEPNNHLKWDFKYGDPGWRKFGEMIRLAAERAADRGVPTVLGGMIPVDPHWLAMMRRYGALDPIDIVGIHAFPGMWWDHAPNWDWYRWWHGWEHKVASIADHAEGRPIWVTETGLATWDLATEREAKHELQVAKLEEAAASPADRVYWYSLIDLSPRRDAIEGFHVDENEYHMGLVTWDGQRKEAYFRMRELLAERRAARPLSTG